ncbi:hypothetical protein C8R45DRAFT_1083154 [Mycena sanguinolenta]|nr:hypothetical protein C8R45DRAFT_1083154 [Mycena sanguinolenta]
MDLASRTGAANNCAHRQPTGASAATEADMWKIAQVFAAALNASVNVGLEYWHSYLKSRRVLAAIRIFSLAGANETIFSYNTWVATGTIPADYPLPADLSSFVQAEVADKQDSGPWETCVTVTTPAANLTGSAWIWSTADANTSAALGSVGFRKIVTSPPAKLLRPRPSSSQRTTTFSCCSDGTSEIVRTDTSWLAGVFTSAYTFLGATDSALAAADLSGLFGIEPFGTLRGMSNALKLSANHAAVVPSSMTALSTSGHTLASTTILPSTSMSAPPTITGAARAFMDGV